MGNVEQIFASSSLQCKGCGKPFEPARSNQHYCDETCKQVAYRKRIKEKRNAEKQMKALRNKQQQKLFVVPCTIGEANAYVQQMHRHHGSIALARLAFAVADETGLVRGVALVGRPCNTYLDDDWTLEVRRVCTDGCPNACSLLYGAAWKAAKAIGYRRLVTYTLPEEGGASLRAVGWKPVLGCGGRPWNHKKRVRQESPLFLTKKTRWEVSVKDISPSQVVFPESSALKAVQELLQVSAE